MKMFLNRRRRSNVNIVLKQFVIAADSYMYSATNIL